MAETGDETIIQSLMRSLGFTREEAAAVVAKVNADSTLNPGEHREFPDA